MCTEEDTGHTLTTTPTANLEQPAGGIWMNPASAQGEHPNSIQSHS